MRAERTNYQYIVLEVDELETGLTRDELVQVLIAENVLARRYFYPGCHRMEPYRSVLSVHGPSSTGNRKALPAGDGPAERNQRGRIRDHAHLRNHWDCSVERSKCAEPTTPVQPCRYTRRNVNNISRLLRWGVRRLRRAPASVALLSSALRLWPRI